MQPRPIAETERELPSVRFSVSFSVSFINDGDPDSAALRRSPTRRLPPGKVYGRDCNPAAGGLPALRVSRDVLLSVLPGTWEPPAARAANGVPGGARFRGLAVSRSRGEGQPRDPETAQPETQ